MNIVFMGTPDFAINPLKALIGAGHNILAVVTQTDKVSPSGKTIQSAVKKYAEREGLKVLQFNKIRSEGSEVLRKLGADIFVTAAYGQILSEEILSIPPFGVINVHASLLPSYRGSSPIQWAVINGETKTGVTIMQTDVGLDTGDILLSKEIEIGLDDNAMTMFDKLSILGGELLVECLDKLSSGSITRTHQDESLASYYPMLKKSDGLIDWKKSAKDLFNFIRGMYPWPGAYTYYNGALVKVLSASVSDLKGKSGEILEVEKSGLTVGCGDAAIHITKLQLEGKKAMDALDIYNGGKFIKGQKLG